MHMLWACFRVEARLRYRCVFHGGSTSTNTCHGVAESEQFVVCILRVLWGFCKSNCPWLFVCSHSFVSHTFCFFAACLYFGIFFCFCLYVHFCGVCCVLLWVVGVLSFAVLTWIIFVGLYMCTSVVVCIIFFVGIIAGGYLCAAHTSIWQQFEFVVHPPLSSILIFRLRGSF